MENQEQDIVMEEAPLGDREINYLPTSKRLTKLSLDHERSGLIEFQIVANDSEDYSMIICILLGFSNFQ
jgi:hypothetical protein